MKIETFAFFSSVNINKIIYKEGIILFGSSFVAVILPNIILLKMFGKKFNDKCFVFCN